MAIDAAKHIAELRKYPFVGCDYTGVIFGTVDVPENYRRWFSLEGQTNMPPREPGSAEEFAAAKIERLKNQGTQAAGGTASEEEDDSGASDWWKNGDGTAQ